MTSGHFLGLKEPTKISEIHLDGGSERFHRQTDRRCDSLSTRDAPERLRLPAMKSSQASQYCTISLKY